MEANQFTQSMGEFTAIFKIEAESLLIQVMSIRHDFLLSAKYTTDNLPKQIKFLFKTPQRLFNKLIKNQGQTLSLGTDNTLIIKLNLADLGDEIQIPLPLEKKPMDLESKCQLLLKELSSRNQLCQRHEKQIEKLKEQKRKLSLHQPVHPINQHDVDKSHHQAHEDVKKYKKKYEQTNMDLINCYFEIDNLKKELNDSQKKVHQLEEEMRIIKENSDRMVSSIHNEYEKRFEEKVKLEVEKKESSSEKTDQFRSAAKIEEVVPPPPQPKPFERFDFNWHFKSLHAEAYKFSGKKVKKNDLQGYQHHQIYSYERIPKVGRFQVTFKILAYGDNDSDLVFGLMASSRCKEDFSGGRGHPKSAGYWTDQEFKNGKIIVDGVQVKKGKELYINNGLQLTLKVDMEAGKIYWCSNKFQVETPMFKNYLNENIFVFVALKNENDSISIE